MNSKLLLQDKNKHFDDIKRSVHRKYTNLEQKKVKHVTKSEETQTFFLLNNELVILILNKNLLLLCIQFRLHVNLCLTCRELIFMLIKSQKRIAMLYCIYLKNPKIMSSIAYNLLLLCDSYACMLYHVQDKLLINLNCVHSHSF